MREDLMISNIRPPGTQKGQGGQMTIEQWKELEGASGTLIKVQKPMTSGLLV